MHDVVIAVFQSGTKRKQPLSGTERKKEPSLPVKSQRGFIIVQRALSLTHVVLL